MSITATINWLAAIREYLLADSGVTGQVSTEVYVEHLPKDASTPGKAIIVQSSGGAPASRMPLADVNVSLRCYGDTAVDAWAVYAVARTALHNVRNQKIELGGGVGSGDLWMLVSKETGLPDYMEEPDAGWPFYLAKFKCKFVTFPVT